MAHAYLQSALGTCVRKKVGCTATQLVNGVEQILTVNYNGVPSKQEHCINIPCEGAKYDKGEGLEACNAIHAEMNALINCDISKLYALYVTCFPCKKCAEVILNTPVKRLYYTENYAKMEETIKLFYKKGIDVVRILPEEIATAFTQ